MTESTIIDICCWSVSAIFVGLLAWGFVVRVREDDESACSYESQRKWKEEQEESARVLLVEDIADAVVRKLQERK